MSDVNQTIVNRETQQKRRLEVARSLTDLNIHTVDHWIGKALFRADLWNQAKIEREFSIYWKEPLVSTEEVEKVYKMMIIYGGHFMANIGRALERATITGSKEFAMRVKRTWPDEWQNFLEMAKMRPELMDDFDEMTI